MKLHTAISACIRLWSMFSWSSTLAKQFQKLLVQSTLFQKIYLLKRVLHISSQMTEKRVFSLPFFNICLKCNFAQMWFYFENLHRNPPFWLSHSWRRAPSLHCGSASVSTRVHGARSMDPLRVTHYVVLPGTDRVLTQVSVWCEDINTWIDFCADLLRKNPQHPCASSLQERQKTQRALQRRLSRRVRTFWSDRYLIGF